jgi:cell division protein FtsQ
MAVYQRMMGDLDSTGQHFSQQISEIDLTDPEDARVLMPEQGADILAHFGEDRFLERYQRYKAHIAEWRQQYPNLAAVDLRYDQQVVLQMASGKETAAQSAPGTQADPQAGALPKPSAAGGAASAAPQVAAARPAIAKPAGSSAAAKKNKAAQEKKKRAEARRAALNEIRRNSAHASRTVPAVAEGQ